LATKRIIPVSSGKGGVGKTTFAINFALSLAEHGKTVLVDLDTGTSAIRHAIDVPVNRDLYHFFRKGEPLGSCVTPLDARLDPAGRFRNFGFVAGPAHLIEEITNFNSERKLQLVSAINSLDADYVVLDLKAGLDPHVIDFLPFSNSGILIFTPHLPSATLAASDIVKSIIFRKLRLIFARNSPFYESVTGRLDFWKLANDLIDQVEDVYDSSVPNLDAFLTDLQESLGDHPVTRAVATTLETFRIHYVLNLFSGVDESFDAAVKPFLRNVIDHVSSRCRVTNLGWITRSDTIHRANSARVPALLYHDDAPQSGASADAWEAELEDLRITAIGLEPPRRRSSPRAERTRAREDDPLAQQLDVLRTMFAERKSDDFRANFEYIAHRALFTMRTRRPGEFGDARIYSPEEMLRVTFERSS
jgi:MinD-like ATPase involved in chromosome partitioning or flagellar assembly